MADSDDKEEGELSEEEYDPFTQEPAEHVKKPKEKAPPPKPPPPIKLGSGTNLVDLVAQQVALRRKISENLDEPRDTQKLPAFFTDNASSKSAGPPPGAPGPPPGRPPESAPLPPGPPAGPPPESGVGPDVQTSDTGGGPAAAAMVGQFKAAGAALAPPKSKSSGAGSLMTLRPKAPPEAQPAVEFAAPTAPPHQPFATTDTAALEMALLSALPLPQEQFPMPQDSLAAVLPDLPGLAPMPMMLGAPLPVNISMMGVPHAAAVAPANIGPVELALQPGLAPFGAAPGVGVGPLEQWEEHISPQGMPFYFCKRTGESRWVRPQGPADVIEPAAAGAVAAAAPKRDIKAEIGEPESWESIGKTGWLRVETDKGLQYYFHKKKKITAWTCPKEIAKEVAELDGVLGTPAPPEAPSAAAAPTAGDTASVSAADEKPAAKETAAPEAETPPMTKAEKQKASQEQKEEEQKASKEKQRLLNFKQMMIEKGVKPFDKFDKWVPKLIHDPRFTAVPGQKERKALFDVFAKKIDAERKKQATAAKKGGRESFREILAEAEQKGLLHDRTLEAAQRALEKRYEDDSRWGVLPEKERERLISEAVAASTKKRKDNLEKAQHEFRTFVREFLKGKEDDLPRWDSARRKLEKDSRWGAEEGVEREKIYKQMANEILAAQREKKKRQRQDQAEMDDARKKRRLGEAEADLYTLFAEKIRNPYGMDWDEALSLLGDRGKQMCLELSDEEQVRLWSDYKERLIATRREQFLALLTNTAADVIGPDMDFEEILGVCTADANVARALAGMPEEIVRGTWEEWRQQAYLRAVDVCRKWLKSCEHFRGTDGVEPGGFEFAHLLQQLSDDVRFSRIRKMPEVQKQLVVDRLEELKALRAKGTRAGADSDDEG